MYSYVLEKNKSPFTSSDAFTIFRLLRWLIGKLRFINKENINMYSSYIGTGVKVRCMNNFSSFTNVDVYDIYDVMYVTSSVNDMPNINDKFKFDVNDSP